jgi:hypothetical protein
MLTSSVELAGRAVKRKIASAGKSDFRRLVTDESIPVRLQAAPGTFCHWNP